MTNSEDVKLSQAGYEFGREAERRYSSGFAGPAFVDALGRLFDAHTQAKDQRIAELEADVEQRRHSLEHANATILRQREKLAALEARSISPKHPALTAQINAAPEPLRAYVYELETLADPTGNVQELVARRENQKGLEILLTESRAEVERLTKERDEERRNKETVADVTKGVIARLRDRCKRAEKALAAAQVAISSIKTWGFDHWGTADALKQFEDLSGASLSPGQPEGEKA